MIAGGLLTRATNTQLARILRERGIEERPDKFRSFLHGAHEREHIRMELVLVCGDLLSVHVVLERVVQKFIGVPLRRVRREGKKARSRPHVIVPTPSPASHGGP